MPNSELWSRITSQPDILGGKPILPDMRISVKLILSLLPQGITPEAILEDHPSLKPDDIRAPTAYADTATANDRISQSPPSYTIRIV